MFIWGGGVVQASATVLAAVVSLILVLWQEGWGSVQISHEDRCSWRDWSDRAAAAQSGSSARTLRDGRRQKPGKTDADAREPQGKLLEESLKLLIVFEKALWNFEILCYTVQHEFLPGVSNGLDCRFTIT